MRLLIAAPLLAAMLTLSGCGLLPEDDPNGCHPVDPGGECFEPTRDAFRAHAIGSTRAWPQLAGLAIEADQLIEGRDAVVGERTWIVPLRSGDSIVAAARFLPFGDEVRLGEITLYQPPRRNFPVPDAGEDLVLVEAACGDPLPASCLFQSYGWRLEPDS